jgi:hypothetical protein
MVSKFELVYYSVCFKNAPFSNKTVIYIIKIRFAGDFINRRQRL